MLKNINNTIYNFNDIEVDIYLNLPTAMIIYQKVLGEIKVVLVNNSAETLFKRKKQDIKEKLDNGNYNFVHSDDIENFMFMKKDLIKNGGKKSLLYRVYINEKKEYIWLGVNIQTKIMDSGEILYFVFYTNISKECISVIKQKEQSKNNLQKLRNDIIDESTTEVFVIDKNTYELLYISRNAQKNHNFKDSTGKMCYEMIFGKKSPCINCKTRQKVINKPYEVYVSKENKTYMVTSKEIVWNEKKAYIQYVSDITEYIQMRHKYFFEFQKHSKQMKKFFTSAIVDIDEDRFLEFCTSDKDFNEELIFNKSYEKVNLFASRFIESEEHKKWIKNFSPDNIKKHYNREFKDEMKVISYKKDGNKKWLKVDTRIIVNPMNKHWILFVCIEDITENILSKKLIDYLISTEYDFISIVDINTDKGLRYTNKKYNPKKNPQIVKDFFRKLEKQLKYMDENMSESTIESICNKEKLLNYVKRYGLYEKRFSYKKEDIQLYKDLKIFYVDEENGMICFMLSDITDVVKQEKIKNIKLQKVSEEAKKADRAKSEFLARMSHDMRTPMNAIINYSKFGKIESDSEELYNYFDQIENSGTYLLGIINDILEFSQLKEGKLKICKKPEDLDAFIKNIKHIIIPKAKQKNISVTIVNKNKNIKYKKMDKIRNAQVIVNVINNALKYTDFGGKVNWTLDSETKHGKTYCKHIIEDNGIGMSEEFQKKAFNLFSREENKFSIKEGGSGLGLAITKRIVNAIGGEISFVSEYGKGTTFTILFRCDDVSEEEFLDFYEDKTLNKKFISLKNKKVLICEDIKVNAKILSKILESENIKFDIAENGEIGVQKVKQNNYDAVLMDIRMPVLDGLEATKQIRKFNKQIPIIALSANAYVEDIQKSLKIGMNDHLSKPIDKHKLLKSLSENIKIK